MSSHLVTASALAFSSWMGGTSPDVPALSPDRRGQVMPDRTFDLQRLALDLRLLPEERAVEGTATYTVTRLWHGPAVLDQIELEIREVRGPDGPLSWRTAGDTLVIDLPETFGAQGEQSFQVSWRAEPHSGMHFREAERGGPDQYDEIWTQGEGEDHRHWFPGWDHPGDRFVYEGAVQAPEGWVALTNSGHDMVNYLVMVAAAPYEITRHPDIPGLEVWAPPGSDKDAVARVLDPMPAMMTHMGARTGVPYPWGPYRQVFVQRFMYTGMENTSATIQHETMLVGERIADTNDWVESVVAHELAHQWYGDLLTCRDWRELWLNEGFATFMAADWMQVGQGEDAHAQAVRGWLDSIVGHQQPMAGRFFHGAGAAHNSNVYSRGAGVLHMLRVYLGEERFWAGIRLYTTRHSRALVHTRDLQMAMEEVSGRDLGWFFQQWVELGHAPSLRVSHRYADGRLRMSVTQQLGEDQPRFSLPVVFEIGLAGGEVLRREGFMDEATRELELELAEPPLWVAFDPDGAVAARVEHDREPAELAAMLGSPSPLVRLAAIRGLGETDRPAELSAILADPSRPWALRTAAASALGAQRQSAPLVAALRDAEDRVRRAAAGALASAADRSPAGPLRRVAEGDRNPDVAAAALRSLAAVQPDLALAPARDTVRRATDRDERGLRTAAFEVLGEHGAVADLPLLLDERLPYRMRNTAFGAAARIVAREELPQRTKLAARVARVVEPMLSDLDQRSRERAVDLLAEVGDSSSVNKLEQLRRTEKVRSLQERAERAIVRIQSRKEPTATPPGEEAARLEALEKRLGELEETLEDELRRH